MRIGRTVGVVVLTAAVALAIGAASMEVEARHRPQANDQEGIDALCTIGGFISPKAGMICGVFSLFGGIGGYEEHPRQKKHSRSSYYDDDRPRSKKVAFSDLPPETQVIRLKAENRRLRQQVAGSKKAEVKTVYVCPDKRTAEAK